MVGQHIRILKGGRWVHAVDCGDETVLHLVEEASPPRVRRAYRPEFVAGAVSVEVITHRERTFPAQEIVRRAYSRASDPALAVMFQDSEAFVEWCATGRLPAARNVAVDVPGVALAPTGAAAAAPAASAKKNGKVAGAVVTTVSPVKAKAKVAAKPVGKVKAARKGKKAAPRPKVAVKAKPVGKKTRPAKAPAKRKAATRKVAAKRPAAKKKGRR
jgi:hypothetical protein